MFQGIYAEGLSVDNMATLHVAALILRKQCSRHNAIEPYNAAAYDACDSGFRAIMAVLTDGDAEVMNAATDMLLDNTWWDDETGYGADMSVKHALDRARNDQRARREVSE